jgi:hypothetical protein
LEETIKLEMKAVMQPIRAELDETTSCNRVTETEPDPGIMQSKEEHQEIPKEDAAGMPVGEPRKRCRVCNLAAEHRQKRKERTRGNRGSRKELAVTHRKVLRRAKAAWCKRNIARKECTRANVVQELQRGRLSRMRRWIGTEGSNGIRDQGLKQKLQGNKRIKDLGSRLPLCPRNKRTSSWTYRKTIGSVKIAKQKARSYAVSWKLKDWTLWSGRPPSN